MERIRLGFMEMCSPPLVEALDGSGRRLRRSDLAQEAVEFLIDSGYEVISYDTEGVVDTPDKAWNGMREFVYREVDAVVFYYSTWIWITHYMQAARKARLPIVSWAPAVAHSWSLNSVCVASGAMREWGIPYKPVWGLPGDDGVARKIRAFAKAAQVKRILEKSKFGLFGGTSMGIAAGFADFNEWGRKFGIFTEHTSELVIVEEAKKVPPEEVEETYLRLKEKYGKVPPTDETVERSIRHYLAYRRIIEQKGYDFTALKCTFDASGYYVAACLSQSLLAEDGFVSTCEGDCYAALTERILSILTDEPFFMADLQHVKPEENVAVLVDDGACSPRVARSPKDVHLCPQWTGEAETGGICTSLIARPGKVTLARISRVGEDRHVCLIARGEAFEVPREKLSEYCDCGFPNWPHAFVRLDGDMEKFIEAMNVEYIHMVYGDLTEELVETCRLLEIEPEIVQRVR